jgi:3,4-dihydroxy-2-butanone 4-phosphate synthase
MARVPDLIRFCRRHGLLMITVADLARYRIEVADDDPLDAIDRLFLCA